jgi:glutathione S-transferase
MPPPTLYIGNKNYSSWSLRPWLALKWAGLAFNEEVRRLGDDPCYGVARSAHILAISPSGRVPALHVDDIVINDSLAICEWAHEQTKNLWPADRKARALARAAAAEMHSGFPAIRRAMSMNIRRRLDRAPAWDDDVRRDLDRLFSLWGGARQRYGAAGPWLFGVRSIADAMFAPVATRLRTYAVEAPDIARAYVETALADEAFKEWERGALAETWGMPATDGLYR